MKRVLAALMCVASLVMAGTYRLEGEKISDLGQWEVQPHGKASALKYLFSKSKNDNIATAIVDLPEDGTYYVWGRTITMLQNWRKTEVAINGTVMGKFGDEKKEGATNGGFVWARSEKPIALKQGANTITLKALSDVSRFDVLVITTDENYVPGDSVDGIAELNFAVKPADAPADVAAGINADSTDGGTYLLEAEKCNDLGKWVIQAHGRASALKFIFSKAKANNVATAKVALPNGGAYYVWGRTLTMLQNWRKTEVAINGTAVGKFGDENVEGATNGGFVWTRSEKPITLKAGVYDITFTPLSDVSRFDALILTSDEQFVPGDNLKDIPELKVVGEKKETVILPVTGEKKNPSVMLFHGGRPWTGNDIAAVMQVPGLCVTTLNSVYLNGLGGASIKTFLTDKEEPKAKDGITVAFKDLNKYKAVLFTAIPRANMEKILTPERVEMLKKYVEEGGVVLVSGFAPNSLQPLLPVQLAGGDLQFGLSDAIATRPANPDFAFLPETFPVLGGVRVTKALDDAEVWSMMKKDGQDIGPYIAAKSFGKGKVVFFAFDYGRINSLRQVRDWAYGSKLLCQMVGTACSIPLDINKLKPDLPEVPRVKQDKVEITIAEPRMDLIDVAKKPVITEKDGAVQVQFANGNKLDVAKDGMISITYAGTKRSMMRFTKAPDMQFFAAMSQELNDAELSENSKKGVKIKATNWVFKGAEVKDNTVLLHYTNEDGAFDWQFKAGILALDGRQYEAIAQRINILNYKGNLQNVTFNNEICLGETLAGHQLKRLACYASPRGYSEMDYSGAQNANSGRNGFFSDGQPFTWITAPEGIYSSFTEEAQGISTDPSVTKGASCIKENMVLSLGRKKAPVSGKYIWHCFSAGAEKPHNDWMAMYQFQRHNLRVKAGLKEIPSVPTASMSNTTTGAQQDKAIEAAGKLHFQQFHLQLCPSPITTMATDSLAEQYKKIRAQGIKPRPWTPADYFNGYGEGFVNEHKDYFLRNPDGTIYAYSGLHPVLDMNKEVTREWYHALLKQAVDNGMGAIYIDMGGAQTGNVNFEGEESDTGLVAAIDNYRYYHSLGIQVGIEGMTPLGLNSFWYRRSKYLPFVGNEFSLIGSLCYTNEGADLDLDYFRMAMYDSFMLTHVEGYALNFERRSQEIAKIARAGKLNEKINEALELTEMPFIRETSFGTTWYGKNGAAVFCYSPVDNLVVNFKGKKHTFKNVEQDSILIIK